MTEVDFQKLIPADCYELLQHVWDLLDGQLTEDRRADLERHLDDCEGCRRYAAFQESFLAAMASLGARGCAPDSLRERVRRTLAEAGFTGSPAPELRRPSARGDGSRH